MGNETLHDIPLDEEELLKRVQRLEDYIAITNNFSRYLQYLALQWCEGVLSTFAIEREDCSFEASKTGLCIGYESIKSFFDCLPQLTKRRGVMTEHHTTAPVIEIAEDGKTAKYTSISPGIKIMAPARVQVWSWFRYCGDMIKLDNGEWKIWHLHCFHTFEAEMERGPIHTQFTQGIEKTCEGLTGYQIVKPVKPTTYLNFYDPEKYNYMMPDPAVAYKTWDGFKNLSRSRPYMNPDMPETMKEGKDNVVHIGRDTASI
jgi:hypothetical protein